MSEDNKQKNTEEMTDEELDQVYKEEAVPYRDSLLRYAMKICNSKADAEDLVQDTMLRAYRFIDKYEPGTNCQAWLYTIMNNLYNNRYKRYKKSPNSVTFDEAEKVYDRTAEGSLSSINSDPESSMLRNILSEEILKAVRQLSMDFRITMILVDIHNFSYEEASKLLDCPIGTVMSRLHRARNILQDMLEDYAEKQGVLDNSDDPETITWI